MSCRHPQHRLPRKRKLQCWSVLRCCRSGYHSVVVPLAAAALECLHTHPPPIEGGRGVVRPPRYLDLFHPPLGSCRNDEAGRWGHNPVRGIHDFPPTQPEQPQGVPQRERWPIECDLGIDGNDDGPVERRGCATKEGSVRPFLEGNSRSKSMYDAE